MPSGLGANNALAYVMTDASGDISGVWSTPDGNEGDWSGFQIAYGATLTPEPGSVLLVSLGLVFGFIVMRKRVRGQAPVAE